MRNLYLLCGMLICLSVWGEGTDSTGTVLIQNFSFFKTQVTFNQPLTLTYAEEGVHQEGFKDFILKTHWPEFQKWFQKTYGDLSPDFKAHRLVEVLHHVFKEDLNKDTLTFNVTLALPNPKTKTNKAQERLWEAWESYLKQVIYDTPERALRSDSETCIVRRLTRGRYMVLHYYLKLKKENRPIVDFDKIETLNLDEVPDRHSTPTPRLGMSYHERFYNMMKPFGGSPVEYGPYHMLKVYKNLRTDLDHFLTPKAFHKHVFGNDLTFVLKSLSPTASIKIQKSTHPILIHSNGTSVVPVEINVCTPFVMKASVPIEKILKRLFNPNDCVFKQDLAYELRDDYSLMKHKYFACMQRLAPIIADEMKAYFLKKFKPFNFEQESKGCLSYKGSFTLSGSNVLSAKVAKDIEVDFQRQVQWKSDKKDAFQLTQTLSDFFAESLPLFNSKDVGHHFNMSAYKTKVLTPDNAPGALNALFTNLSSSISFSNIHHTLQLNKSYQTQSALKGNSILLNGLPLSISKEQVFLVKGRHVFFVPQTSYDWNFVSDTFSDKGRLLLKPHGSFGFDPVVTLLSSTSSSWTQQDVVMLAGVSAPGDSQAFMNYLKANTKIKRSHLEIMYETLKQVSSDDFLKWHLDPKLFAERINPLRKQLAQILIEQLSDEIQKADQRLNLSEQENLLFKGYRAVFLEIRKKNKKSDDLTSKEVQSKLANLKTWTTLIPNYVQLKSEVNLDDSAIVLLVLEYILKWVEDDTTFKAKNETPLRSEKKCVDFAKRFLAAFLQKEAEISVQVVTLKAELEALRASKSKVVIHEAMKVFEKKE